VKRNEEEKLPYEVVKKTAYLGKRIKKKNLVFE